MNWPASKMVEKGNSKQEEHDGIKKIEMFLRHRFKKEYITYAEFKSFFNEKTSTLNSDLLDELTTCLHIDENDQISVNTMAIILALKHNNQSGQLNGNSEILYYLREKRPKNLINVDEFRTMFKINRIFLGKNITEMLDDYLVELFKTQDVNRKGFITKDGFDAILKQTPNIFGLPPQGHK